MLRLLLNKFLEIVFHYATSIPNVMDAAMQTPHSPITHRAGDAKDERIPTINTTIHDVHRKAISDVVKESRSAPA